MGLLTVMEMTWMYADNPLIKHLTLAQLEGKLPPSNYLEAACFLLEQVSMFAETCQYGYQTTIRPIDRATDPAPGDVLGFVMGAEASSSKRGGMLKG
jgi:hypothetical protein